MNVKPMIAVLYLVVPLAKVLMAPPALIGIQTHNQCGCSAYESALTVLSFAQSPDGVCWAFPSGTVPDGWPECASVDECECADFSLDECEANNCNLLSGRPATENADGTTCIDWSIDPQPAGCTSENSSEAVISFAQDPDGVCWFFPSGTVPSGWSECPYVDECE